jgi:hypothetical protein
MLLLKPVRSVCAAVVLAAAPACFVPASVTGSITDDEELRLGAAPPEKVIRIDERAVLAAREAGGRVEEKPANPGHLPVIVVLTVFAAVAGWGFSRKRA